MNKIISSAILFIVLIAITASLNSQTLYFCEDVDGSGYPIGESSTFNISRDGGWLKMLVRLPYDVNCRSVRFEVYRKDSYGYETYDNTIRQDVERDWRWFWQKITFYSAGSYNVYCYDCSDYLLTSGSIRINYK